MAILSAAGAFLRGNKLFTVSVGVGVVEGVGVILPDGVAVGVSVGVGTSKAVGVAVGVRVVFCFSRVWVIS